MSTSVDITTTKKKYPGDGRMKSVVWVLFDGPAASPSAIDCQAKREAGDCFRFNQALPFKGKGVY